MNVQRHLGLLLVILQAAAIGFFFHTPLFSIAMVGAAMIGALSSIRIATPYAARRWVIVLAVLYAVQRAVMPPAWYSGAASFLFPESCLIAEYFLLFQVGQFFVRREGDRLPSYMPMLAIVAMTFAADVRVDSQGRLVFQIFTAGLVILSALFFSACRWHHGRQLEETPRRRHVLLGTVLLTSIALGWCAASNLYRHARRIETILGRMVRSSMQPDSAGFSGQGRLGSVTAQKKRSGDRVALRIFADEAPGYLRGRAFGSYANGQWQEQSQRITLAPTDAGDLLPQTSLGSESQHTFLLLRANPESWERLEIWPNQEYREVVFAPPGLAALEASAEQVSMNLHGIVEAERIVSGNPYTVWCAPGMAGVLSPIDTVGGIQIDEGQRRALLEDWDTLTQLPEDLDPRVHQLAMRVVGNAATNRDKIAAVERYFLGNYRYQFGIDVPSQVDPLTYFLLEKPPAHCEFFASGATILLRAAGVPSRYVTGFVAAEKNDYGDYWIARNRDAHAWAEAFDPARGWVLVEATPAGGVPQEASASTASQMWDAIRTGWQRLVAFLRQGGLMAIARVCARALMHPALLIPLLALAAGTAVWRLRLRRRRVRPQSLDPTIQQLQRLLRQMDRHWQKAGLTRAPCETLHQFAGRIESAAADPTYAEAAAWYRRFAEVRYRGQANAEAVGQLQEACGQVKGPRAR
jgi:hypothetical protein